MYFYATKFKSFSFFGENGTCFVVMQGPAIRYYGEALQNLLAHIFAIAATIGSSWVRFLPKKTSCDMFLPQQPSPDSSGIRVRSIGLKKLGYTNENE